MDIWLLDILKMKGLELTSDSRIVRHQSRLHPVDELRRNGWLELYQRYQIKPKFHKVDWIVSFYGLTGTRAAFYGVYRVQGCRPAIEGITLPECSWSEEWKKTSSYFYDLERNPDFDGFRDRLVVDWGPGALSWVQRDCNKRVLEIQESGRRLEPFDDYLEFSLSFTQIKELFANEEAHREWRARLSAVSGVYLILAEHSGDLYVGSAYGADGIWGRWRQYAKSGHGGNSALRDLMRREPIYPERFRFSILQILPKTMAREEVIRREVIYKEKLGSRATGLNMN